MPTVEDLVVEALNTVYVQLGEHAALGQEELTRQVVAAATEYVATCYEEPPTESFLSPP